MDISLKIKRVIASVSAFALLVAYTPLALAQTFNDVPSDAWFFDYVEQGVDQGIFDSSDNFRPGDALNRAELVKIVVTAIDGLAGYEAPATPTFDDVPTDAWFYDYVEAAVAEGIVSGYTDANGNLTGQFGPGDTVNRAAATKILVNAFAIATDLNPGNTFGDVSSGDWFHDFVVTAYNQSVLDGYDNGNFGPADPVTRAQVAKLTQTAQNPVERVVASDDDDEPVVSSSDGDLEVSLNDDTAASATVPRSGHAIDLISIDLTAADDDVVLNNLVVTRGGVGVASDWENLYIYDGTERLTTGRSINSDTNVATFAINVEIDAGTTKSLRVVGDMASTATATNQHYFYVASASDVSSNAQAVVGDFPVTGNTFTTGQQTVTSLTVATGTQPANPQVGEQGAEIAAVKMTAGAENDIALHQITLTQNESLSVSNLENLELIVAGETVATADGFGDSERVTFVLDTPYIIPEGQIKNFFVNADIVGGRPGDDQIELYLDEDSDVIAIDQQYGFGASITNNLTTALVTELTLEGGDITITDNGPAATQIAQNDDNVPLFDITVVSDRHVLVKEMDLTARIGIGGDYTNVPASTTTTASEITDLGGTANLQTGFQTANNQGTGGTSALITGQVFSVAVSGTTYYCAVTNTVANTTTTDVTTDCPSVSLNTTGGADVFEITTGIDPYQWLENVGIVDIDTEQTLQGPVTAFNSTTTKSGVTNTTYAKQFTEDYDIFAGETRHLRVEGDIHQNMPSGLEIDVQTSFDVANGDIKDVDSNKDVTADTIVGEALTSNAMTVKQNSLTVSATSNVVSQEIVAGETDVDMFQFAAQAGDAGDIVVKKVNVRFYADTTTTFAAGAAGDTAANDHVISASLYNGNDLVAGPEALQLTGGTTFAADTTTIYYKALFDGLNEVISKGSTNTYTVKVDLQKGNGTTFYLAADMVPSNDIIAEDDDANTINANSGNLNGGANPNPMVTAINNGTLSADSTSGSAVADVLAGGATDQLVAQYKFTAEKEAFNVSKLTVTNQTTGDFESAAEDTNVLTGIKLVYENVNGQEVTVNDTLTSGSREVSLVDNFYIPKDESRTLKIYADTSTITSGTFTLSGKKFRLGLFESNTTQSQFKAVGAASSEAQILQGPSGATLPNTIKNSANIQTFVVRRARPVFSDVAQSTTQMPTTNGTLYKFNVAANGGPVTIARLVFDVTSSGSITDIYDFDFQRNGGTITGLNIYGVGATGATDAALNIEDSALNSGLQDAETGTGGSVTDGLYKVIVTFDNEEIIETTDGEVEYTLKASINGATTDDTVTTSIATGDEETEVSSVAANFDNDNGFSNTTLLSDDGGANQALFTTAAATDYLGNSTTVSASRNVIWSDQSGGDANGGTATQAVHTYPTIASGNVTDATGTADYTNGYLLDIDDLASYSYSK